jgi:glycosidase
MVNALQQMINLRLLFAGLFFLPALLIGQSIDDTIYNDDPEQRLPVGMEKPAHRIIAPTGVDFQGDRVEPPHWWVGMADPVVELLIYRKGVRDAAVEIDYPGVTIREIHRLENPNYLFVELEIAKRAKAGTLSIELKRNGSTETIPYELKARDPQRLSYQGLGPEDVIYLLMPDRFANGDPENDSVEGMTQTGINRDKMFFRHGGDLQGVLDHLDYFEELGVNALWLNPVLENDQPYESYHGYAITDHYRIDRRFGTNELYKELVDACHDRGIKVIMDIIHNHVGDQHWFIRDLPAKDWIHQFDEFTRTTYRAPTLMDPYAAESDKQQMADGWFDHHMPDLNQEHPRLARYLTQNNIWWVEYSGHDAYRVDTYAYPDQRFMSDWGKALQEAYPELSIFGETWVHGPAVQAQFTQANDLRAGYNSHLPAVTDFQLHYAIQEALTQEQGWTSGAARLYYTLAQDFLYEDPYRNVTFLDNHDLSRFYSVVGEDLQKFTSGLAWLFTVRGIPMIYYGTEIGMKNFTDPDGKVREDFPGGWEEDPVSKFTDAGRTELEKTIFNYTAKLIEYRRNTTALQNGKLTQFVPENGLYVFFRHDDTSTVMVVMNTHQETQTLRLDRFIERTKGFKMATDVMSNKQHRLSDESWEVSGYSTWILELR